VADHRETVLAIYQAFQRGDIPFILDRIAPDVRWEDWPAAAPNSAQAAGVPWMRPLRGRENVTQFFQLIGTYKFHRFDVREVLAGGNYACGLVGLEMELPNGAVVREEEMHLFEFNDQGRVVMFRHYLYTAKAMAAAG
jgi:ketosteroid isomerase-like protein